MIMLYCNQQIILKKKTSVNEYNEASYITSLIKCRLEHNTIMIRGMLGQELLSKTQMFTLSKVLANDLIVHNDESLLVLAVHNVADLFGNISFYEVFL